MNICVTAQGPDLESRFEPHFAKAPFFIFYDSRTGRTDAIRNGYIVNDSKIGQNVVKLLASHKIKNVITGSAGDNARILLNGSNISLYVWRGEGTVRDAITQMLTDRIQKKSQQIPDRK